MKWCSLFLSLALLFALISFLPLPVLAAHPDNSSQNARLTMPWKSFALRVNWLNFVQHQEAAESEINPYNHLGISDYTLASFLRPDFQAAFPQLQLSFKPRLELRRDQWDDGPDRGRTKTTGDFFVNEYAVRLPLGESVLISCGREDLQWGPAFLLSPSNPFFSYNGRNQPKIEVAGADYGRLIWSPNLQWSGSLIINTSRGRKKLLTVFEQTYAVKLDYLAEKAYFSLVFSDQEHTGSTRLGGFFSWNVSDSTIIYSEGSVSDEEVEILSGCSYTFGGGDTISAEYFYNGSGVNHGPLMKKLLTLDETEGRESLFRQHYLLLQYYDHDPLSTWNILLRETINLDDKSFSLLAHGEYNIGDHSQLFATGTLNHGDRESELASLVDSSFMVGLELTY